jgi:hypothetical protein
MTTQPAKKNDWSPWAVDIDNIVETAEDFVRVIVSKTRQTATIKRRYILDVFPGRFFVPLWLARILLKPQTDERGNNDAD